LTDRIIKDMFSKNWNDCRTLQTWRNQDPCTRKANSNFSFPRLLYRQHVLESDIVNDSILRLPPLVETAEAGVLREVISNFLFETCSTFATGIAIKSTKTVTDESGASRQQNVKDIYIVCSRRCGGRCSS